MSTDTWVFLLIDINIFLLTICLYYMYLYHVLSQHDVGRRVGSSTFFLTVYWLFKNIIQKMWFWLQMKRYPLKIHCISFLRIKKLRFIVWQIRIWTYYWIALVLNTLYITIPYSQWNQVVKSTSHTLVPLVHKDCWMFKNFVCWLLNSFIVKKLNYINLCLKCLRQK